MRAVFVLVILCIGLISGDENNQDDLIEDKHKTNNYFKNLPNLYHTDVSVHNESALPGFKYPILSESIVHENEIPDNETSLNSGGFQDHLPHYFQYLETENVIIKNNTNGILDRSDPNNNDLFGSMEDLFLSQLNDIRALLFLPKPNNKYNNMMGDINPKALDFRHHYINDIINTLNNILQYNLTNQDILDIEQHELLSAPFIGGIMKNYSTAVQNYNGDYNSLLNNEEYHNNLDEATVKFPYVRSKRFVPISPSALVLQVLLSRINPLKTRQNYITAQISKQALKYQIKFGLKLTYSKTVDNTVYSIHQRTDSFVRYIWQNHTGVTLQGIGWKSSIHEIYISISFATKSSPTLCIKAELDLVAVTMAFNACYNLKTGGTASWMISAHVPFLKNVKVFASGDYVLKPAFQLGSYYITLGAEIQISTSRIYISKSIKNPPGMFEMGYELQAVPGGFKLSSQQDGDAGSTTIAGNLNLLRLVKSKLNVYASKVRNYDRKFKKRYGSVLEGGLKLAIVDTLLQASISKATGKRRKYVAAITQKF